LLSAADGVVGETDSLRIARASARRATIGERMSAEWTNNHYVPQWYQRQFIPAGQAARELYLLDLKPERFRDGNGVRRRRKALRRAGTRHCFAIDDLYTTRLGGIESRELERVFFGEVDSRGKRAVEFFARFDHDSMQEAALQDLMRYMSTQKLRTPKGVTVYNRSCTPGNPRWCKGPDDPDIRLHATHTLFPLSSERLLILTNRLWACNPHRPPLETRPNPNFFRGAMFNFLEIQARRVLSEQGGVRHLRPSPGPQSLRT
jgi:Protein of unknown function (DUF4238)